MSDGLAALDGIVARMRAAFLAEPYPTLETRIGRLRALQGMMAAHQPEVVAAMSADFGSHPPAASAITEVVGLLGRAQYAIDNLPRYMAPEPRDVDPGFFGSAVAEIRWQPKGVCGIMVPWNFPFDLAAGPLIDMLAAGNRVVIKPSELTPACSALLARMVAGAFADDLVTVVEGEVDLSRAFASVRWDHLLYTGSPAIGREVAVAAARNLVPVTLELGGKCPAILGRGAVGADAVRDVVGTKLIKNGQVCVSVDYALVPRGELDRFVDLATGYVRSEMPDYSRTEDCAGIISAQHVDRITGLIDDARAKGARIVVAEEGGTIDRATRRMPLTLVVDPPADARVMAEEIFGPILPVVPYDDLDGAIAHVNAGERPLGLYVFGDEGEVTAVSERTVSGGLAVNCCAMQSALPSMGFGGVGMSGTGRHHGPEGFREFSNPRGTFVRGESDLIAAFYPPYRRAEAILEAMAAAPPAEQPEVSLD